MFLCGSPVSTKSKMLVAVSLSVTEVELFAGCNCIQDLLFIKQILELMGLKVKMPMILQMDNKGAINLVNNWGLAGCTRHVCTKINFLQELKEELLLSCDGYQEREILLTYSPRTLVALLSRSI